jgi:excisionase family DNA binding protein
MLTVTQAAAKLGISARRVRVLCEQGRIKAEKVSARLWLINEPVKIQPPKQGKK